MQYYRASHSWCYNFDIRYLWVILHSCKEKQRYATLPPSFLIWCTVRDGRISPGCGKTGRMADTGQGGRFSLSGRYSAIENGTGVCSIFFCVDRSGFEPH